MPASGFQNHIWRNWSNPTCSFYLSVSMSRIDPVILKRNSKEDTFSTICCTNLGLYNLGLYIRLWKTHKPRLYHRLEKGNLCTFFQPFRGSRTQESILTYVDYKWKKRRKWERPHKKKKTCDSSLKQDPHTETCGTSVQQIGCWSCSSSATRARFFRQVTHPQTL